MNRDNYLVDEYEISLNEAIESLQCPSTMLLTLHTKLSKEELLRIAEEIEWMLSDIGVCGFIDYINNEFTGE